MWCSWNGYHGVYYREHHNGLGLLSSVLEGFPGVAVDHGGDTTSSSVVACYKSGCSPLDSFNLLDVLGCMRVPHCRCIFHLWLHEGFVAAVLDLPRAR